MMNYSRTMVTSPTVHSTERITITPVPCEFSARQHLNQVNTEKTERRASQIGGEFLHQSQHFDCRYTIVTSKEKQLGKINEIRNMGRYSRNVIVPEGWNVRHQSGRELIGPYKDTSVGNFLKEDCLKSSLKPRHSPKSSRKSLLTPDYRRRREKANEREKQRILVLKRAMNVLKNSIPAAREKTKITKLEILNLAQEYISSLTLKLLNDSSREGEEQVASSTAFFQEEDLLFYCNYDSG